MQWITHRSVVSIFFFEVEEKFRYLVDPVMPNGIPAAIVDMVNEIEAVKDIDEIVKLLVVPPAPGARAAAE